MSKRYDSKGRILRSGESQRNDGRYMFQYTGLDGKRHTIYSTRLERRDRSPAGTTTAEPSLREKEAAIQQNLQDGIKDSGGDLTVLQLAERYVATRTDVRQKTKSGYKTTLNIIRRDSFGLCRIDHVKQSDAKLWLIKLQQQDHRRYSSIQNIRGVLRPAFQMAVDDDLIRKNPFEFPLSQVLRNDTQKRNALSPAQEEIFLDFIKSDSHYRKYYEAIYILFNTGLRISEFCGLTPDAIDFNKRCIHVTGQLIRQSTMITEFEPTKTECGLRDIPMSDDVADCFRSLARKRAKVLVEPIIDGKSGFYCLDKNGQPMVALHWEHVFDHILVKYNKTHSDPLPKVTPHVCRHTFCTKMARKGMNPKNLQYIMGHAEYSITMDVYTDLGYEDALAEFDRVNGK